MFNFQRQKEYQPLKNDKIEGKFHSQGKFFEVNSKECGRTQLFEELEALRFKLVRIHCIVPFDPRESSQQQI